MAKLKEVFVAGGMPSITYFDRQELKLEAKLRSELAEGFKIIAVTGPTKSGKTVLCRKVIPDKSCVRIDGGQIETADDFWGETLRALNLPSEESLTTSSILTASIKALIGLQAQLNSGSIVKFAAPSKKQILQLMRERGLTLIIDDFHYMLEDIQREVVRSLKSEVFEGLSVILIAVPHRAFDTISAEPEMEGRYAHIEIPPWAQHELIAIPRTGFAKLRMNVDPIVIDGMCCEAMQSPLLIQRFCARLCTHYQIEESLKKLRDFQPTDEVIRNIYKGVAQQFGFPTFKKVAKGPQSRSKRNPRKLKNSNETVDIYQAILMAVAKTGPKAKLHYDDIREHLKEILSETDIPQKHEVSGALGHMETIARQKNKRGTCIGVGP